MSGITIDIAKARLELYLTAEAKVLASQAYEIEGRKLTRADLTAIRNGISYWSSQVASLDAAPRARGRMRRGSYGLR